MAGRRNCTPARLAKGEYRAAAAQGDLSVLPVWASEAIDLITDVPSARDLVGVLVREAEDALTQINIAAEVARVGDFQDRRPEV